MKSTMRAFAAFAVAGSIALSGCGGVDRAGTKKNILKGFEGSGISADDQSCVANIIDKYSDSDLKKMDKALEKNATAPTEPLALEFIAKTKECVVGSTRKAVVDSVVSAFPDITEAQKSCVTDFISKKSAAELESGGEALGQEIAKSCLV
jgi:hypothetical protein